MKLIDAKCLNMGSLVLKKFDTNYMTLPYCEEVFADKDTFEDICQLFVGFTDFEPKVTPHVIVSTQGMLQKVLPLRAYRKDKVLFVMWGGYSHKDHWFEVPFGSYEVDVLDNTSVALLGNYAINLVEEPNNVSKELTKAGKLADLEIGTFEIESVKPVATKFGEKFIAVIQGREYWANKQLTEYISMLGDVSVLSGMTLNVISKGTTSSGYKTVRVGLSR